MVSSPSPCRKATKVGAALATAQASTGLQAQLPDGQVYKQPPVFKSFVEELGAFSLTPDVEAQAGVGAKSGFPVFNRNPRSKLIGKMGRNSLLPGLGLLAGGSLLQGL